MGGVPFNSYYGYSRFSSPRVLIFCITEDNRIIGYDESIKYRRCQNVIFEDLRTKEFHIVSMITNMEDTRKLSVCGKYFSLPFKTTSVEFRTGGLVSDNYSCDEIVQFGEDEPSEFLVLAEDFNKNRVTRKRRPVLMVKHIPTGKKYTKWDFMCAFGIQLKKCGDGFPLDMSKSQELFIEPSAFLEPLS